VRHFTLLREVDAKLCGPEEQLFELVSAAINSPRPDPRAVPTARNEASISVAPASAPMSAQNSAAGAAPASASAGDPTAGLNSIVFDSSNLPRRQLFRQTAIKIQEMLVALEEKNHVIGTANEALEKQLARIEDVWPYLESEFSDEAKWGSTTHWAYPENRAAKSSHPERARRDGAAAISAAAQALADEAAARSDARKQAVQAKKNLKNSHQDSDFDDHDSRHKAEGAKKSSKVRKTAETNAVGLGITSAANGNPPPKKRKVEKLTNGANAMSTVFGPGAKGKAGSPVDAPTSEGAKKRKALPSGTSQSKKKYVSSSSTSVFRAIVLMDSLTHRNGAAMSPSAASSPVLSNLPEPKGAARASPAPAASVSRPTTSRARGNSIQSVAESSKARPPPSVKPNGAQPANQELAPSTSTPRLGAEPKLTKELSVPVKTESSKKETEKIEPPVTTTIVPPPGKKDSKIDDNESRKSESVPPAPQSIPMVMTKSGRASKPSTPALATFQEAARPRSGRNEGSNNKKGHKKTSSTVQAFIPPPMEDGATSGDGDNDADEPTYCYCNGVSYGQMVACDSDDCTREWFHLACVGLRTPPAEESKFPEIHVKVLVGVCANDAVFQAHGIAKTARNA
jgi:hypothetical protein